jgi:glycosyltransferase involved in cell wall biosynthesis
MMEKRKKIVILSPYPFNGAPSQRFRFEQQIIHLQKYFDVVQLSFWTNKSNAVLYKKGKIVEKGMGLLLGIIRRKIQLFQVMNADIVFIHREIVPIGTLFFEWIIAKLFRKKIIFDFDDAIWRLDTSNENKKLEWLKNADKVKKIISLSTHVIAGNNYLSDYAKLYNKKVSVIPTTIDTNYHLPTLKKNNTICIGWTGSKTTIKHFELALPVLKKLKEKYKELITFKVIGDENFYHDELHIVGEAWQMSTEIQQLAEISIGIMPLPDDEWSKGKCGFKGLQYMSMEIPAVLAPVGMNIEIIQDGVNGFLAKNEREWIEKISALIENEDLRTKLGKAGRKTIEDKYSLNAQKEHYFLILNSI